MEEYRREITELQNAKGREAALASSHHLIAQQTDSVLRKHLIQAHTAFFGSYAPPASSAASIIAVLSIIAIGLFFFIAYQLAHHTS